jgi:hypothetical protein
VVSAYGYTAYAISKVRFLNDPSIDLVFFKWSPGEGEVREEPMGKFETQFPQMRDLEIQELRAAGLTGILRCWGNNTLPGSSRRIRVLRRSPPRFALSYQLRCVYGSKARIHET